MTPEGRPASPGPASPGRPASPAEPVEDYLDQLFAGLRTTPRQARRIIAEAEDHLREATAAGIEAGLTEREAQVLGMLRRGHTTAQIASRLEISPITVRRYISDLMRKLGVESREELVRFNPVAGSLGSTADVAI